MLELCSKRRLASQEDHLHYMYRPAGVHASQVSLACDIDAWNLAQQLRLLQGPESVALPRYACSASFRLSDVISVVYSHPQSTWLANPETHPVFFISLIDMLPHASLAPLADSCIRSYTITSFLNRVLPHFCCSTPSFLSQGRQFDSCRYCLSLPTLRVNLRTALGLQTETAHRRGLQTRTH